VSVSGFWRALLVTSVFVMGVTPGFAAEVDDTPTPGLAAEGGVDDAPTPGVATAVEDASTAAEVPPVDLGPEADAPVVEPNNAVALSTDEPEWEGDEWEDDWDDWDDELDTVPSGYPDPFEPVNRVSLTFNNTVDRFVLDPVTRLYRFSLPDFARQTIVRIFANVNSPQVMVNDALQLEWMDAGVIMARLLVNTTAGVGGTMDVAERMGLEPHESGFGQTLAIAGLPPGTYLVLPVLGPANMRDAVGLGVDSLMHPTFYVLGGTDLLIFGGSAGLTARARHFEELQALKESSVDVYAALRSGYYQNRQAEIWSRREDLRTADSQH